MTDQLFSTTSNYAGTVLRVVLGLVLFAHGAQYMLGWFGGNGLKATLQFLTEAMALPWIVALAVICIQFFGAIALVLGMATRLTALAVLGIFVGMISYHVQYGFYMNWSGTEAGEGFEFHLLVLAMCGALLLVGGGAWSLDRMIATSSNEKKQ